jgi:hypothetical protein
MRRETINPKTYKTTHLIIQTLYYKGCVNARKYQEAQRLDIVNPYLDLSTSSLETIVKWEK